MRNTGTETDSLGEAAVPERALRLCAPQFQKFGRVGVRLHRSNALV
jgi:hypothetical protein